MKKIITVLMLALMTLPSYALSAEEGRARLKVGPFKAKVTNNKQTKKTAQSFTMSRSGSSITISAGITRAVINGINSRGFALGVVLLFDSVEGDIVAGETYDLTNSNPNFANTFVLATKSSIRGAKGITTLTSELDENPSIATGQMKVTEYNAETGEIKADISVEITPYGRIKRKGTKVITNKPLKVKMSVDTTLQ